MIMRCSQSTSTAANYNIHDLLFVLVDYHLANSYLKVVQWPQHNNTNGRVIADSKIYCCSSYMIRLVISHNTDITSKLIFLQVIWVKVQLHQTRTKMRMISRSNDRILLKNVKQHPCLFERRCLTFRDGEARELAWTEVSKACHASGKDKILISVNSSSINY